MPMRAALHVVDIYRQRRVKIAGGIGGNISAVLASRPTALKASRLALRANPLPQPLLRKENKHASTKQN